jgi:hypothetical protein
MKTFKNSLLAVVLSSVAFFGCQKKDNDIAKDLDGQWEISKITKGTGVVDPNSMPQSVSLTSCKVQKDNCSGLWISNQGDKNDFFWTVTEKGTLLTIIIDATQPSNQATSDLAEYKGVYIINALTDTSLVITKDNIKMEFKK